MNMASRA